MLKLILLVAFLYGLYRLAFFIVAKTTRISTSTIKSKSVLITGCDTGFGQMIALRLDQIGFRVYAACLLQKSVDDFKKLPSVSNRLIPFVMDVTDQNSVEAGFQFVKNSLQEANKEDSNSEPLLYAIINNAGILKFSFFELTKFSDANLMIQVNYLGLLRVSQAFLPLLKSSQGLNSPHPLLPLRGSLSSRLINIASVAGRTSVPTLSAYCASKFAVEGLSDGLRRELSFWGIKVVIIEPGVMKTPLYKEFENPEFAKNYWNLMTPDQKETYGEEYVASIWKMLAGEIEKGGDPQLVVDALEEAVLAKYPWHRYAVGKDAMLWIVWSYLPAWIGDLVFSGSSSKRSKGGLLPKVTELALKK